MKRVKYEPEGERERDREREGKRERERERVRSAHPNKPCDDLYGSCSHCSVLDLWSGDTRILKDVIGVEPDLWRETQREWDGGRQREVYTGRHTKGPRARPKKKETGRQREGYKKREKRRKTERERERVRETKRDGTDRDRRSTAEREGDGGGGSLLIAGGCAQVAEHKANALLPGYNTSDSIWVWRGVFKAGLGGDQTEHRRL